MRTVYPHVAVIGVDGMGRFNQKAHTPVMDGLFRDGAQTFSACSMSPTISAENWGAVLLGADPMVHRLTNSIVSRCPYTNETLPSVFRRIRSAMPQAMLASCCTWDAINTGMIEQDIGVQKCTAETDEALCTQIAAQVQKKPTFLFVQFDEVDGAGHSFGFGGDKYIEQIEKSDAYIGRIVEAYKKAGIWEDTLFVVTADHGGHRNSHGGYNDTEKYVYLAACGKGIEKSELAYAQTKDVAAIVLYALGLEVPTYDKQGFSAQVPKGLFPRFQGDYHRPVPQAFLPQTRETPDFHAENGLDAILPGRVRLALFFDGDLRDGTGTYSFEEIGHVKYYGGGVSGFYGEFGATGYGVCPAFRFGRKSFSIGVWLKIDPTICEDVSVCGTKAYAHHRKGFEIALQAQDTQILLGNAQGEHVQFVTPFHEFVSEGWLHALYCVDQENAQIHVYYNFRFVRTIPVEARFLGDMDNLPFTVGNDGGHYTNDKEFRLLFNMDDLLVFDGALKPADIEKLRGYYGV